MGWSEVLEVEALFQWFRSNDSREERSRRWVEFRKTQVERGGVWHGGSAQRKPGAVRRARSYCIARGWGFRCHMALRATFLRGGERVPRG